MTSVILLVFLAIPLLAWFLYTKLKWYRYEQYKGYPRPPPALLWGNLKTVKEFFRKGDPRRHYDYAFVELAKHYGAQQIMVLDARPVGYMICLVLSHDIAEQVSKISKTFKYSVTKSPTVHGLDPLGEEWKALRKRYNAGFAPSHLITLLPQILSKMAQFLAHLDNYARSGAECEMDKLCTNLTFDIIGAVTMDVDLNAQLPTADQTPLVKHYRDLIESYGTGATVSTLESPQTYFRRRRIARLVDKGLKTVVRHRFSELKAAIRDTKSDPPHPSSASTSGRSVLALSLQDIDTLTPFVLQQTADQLKSFLFAGHDTTSILLQWCFYELSRTPRVLSALRKELDDVLGPDPDPRAIAETLLSRGEDVLGKLHYLSAIIKEILRLYPPAGSARMPPPGSGFFVNLADGSRVCLDGMVVYLCHYAIHRDKTVYGESANEFRPERWLTEVDPSAQRISGDVRDKLEASTTGPSQSDGKTLPPSAWRPFERGPRSCIGLELSNIEAKVILASTVRKYDFVKVGLGELALDEKGMPVLDERTEQYKVKSELFNKIRITAKPVDATLMKVRFCQPAKN